MRNIVLGIALAALPFSSPSQAQQNPGGTYNATYSGQSSGRGKPWTQHLTLEIASPENGKITGKLNVASRGCAGDYPVEGTFEKSKIKLKTGEGSKTGCGKVNLNLVPEGEKLVGTYGNTPVEFSK